MNPEDQKNITTQSCITGRHFTAATQALNTSVYHKSALFNTVYITSFTFEQEMNWNNVYTLRAKDIDVFMEHR